MRRLWPSAETFQGSFQLPFRVLFAQFQEVERVFISDRQFGLRAASGGLAVEPSARTDRIGVDGPFDVGPLTRLLSVCRRAFNNRLPQVVLSIVVCLYVVLEHGHGHRQDPAHLADNGIVARRESLPEPSVRAPWLGPREQAPLSRQERRSPGKRPPADGFRVGPAFVSYVLLTRDCSVTALIGDNPPCTSRRSSCRVDVSQAVHGIRFSSYNRTAGVREHDAIVDPATHNGP